MNNDEINNIIANRVYSANSMLHQAITNLQESIHIVQIRDNNYIIDGTKEKAQYNKLDGMVKKAMTLSDEISKYWDQLKNM